MPQEIGKRHPCFGEFRCPRCYKKWQSSKAWADYGQQCKACSISVPAMNLQKLFVYICKNCDAKWSWTYISEGMRCRSCRSTTNTLPLDRDRFEDRQFIRARGLRELNDADDESFIDPSREHREDLCEKCLQLGRSCYRIEARAQVPTSDRKDDSTVSEPSVSPIEPTIDKPIESFLYQAPRNSFDPEDNSAIYGLMIIILVFAMLCFFFNQLLLCLH